MKLSEFKNHIKGVTELNFKKEDGTEIPKHFHITEIGQVDKRFMDCGGVTRTESNISIQLWESIDFWHRLEPNKLLAIIELATQKLELSDLEIEIEYQATTIEKFGVEFQNNNFILTTKQTACLASELCTTAVAIKEKILSCCEPKSGCC